MQSAPPHRSQSAELPTTFVSDESLVLRNYDGSETHEINVCFRDANDELAFERTYELGPGEVVQTRTRLPRAVYGVTAQLANGSCATIECLVGSGPGETAVVETGNGVLSLVEGMV